MRSLIAISYNELVTKCTSTKGMLTIAAAATAGICSYKLIKHIYAQSKEYLENKIIDETVDAIIVGLMPHSKLNNLSVPKREEILRKKARLIAMRKRICSQLEKKITDESILSPEHKNKLQKNLEFGKKVFKIIDAFRLDNDFEKEYAATSFMDQTIENSILNSIILTTKPNAECTAQELLEKKTKEIRKAKIISKLKMHVSGIVFNQLIKSELFLNLFGA